MSNKASSSSVSAAGTPASSTPATAPASASAPAASSASGRPASGGPADTAASAPEHHGFQPASPWRRFMSCVYDGIILFGVVFFFGYGFSALTRFHGESGLTRTAFQIYMFVVLGIYFVWFWSRGRWTLPMKTMGVKLVRDDGKNSPLSVSRAVTRYVLASSFFWGGLALIWVTSPYFALLWLVPFAWAVFDGKRRTLYDVLAGTVLIRHDAVKGRQSRFLP